MPHSPFCGVFTALVTPFQSSGEIDFPAFNRLLELQKAAGIQGVVILGTTGESPTLTDEECEQLVIATLAYRTPSFHVYVGAGTNNTKKTIEKSIKYSCLSNGTSTLDGIMLVSPYYNKPQSQHLINHFTAVCTAISSVPVCLYNHPGRTGVNLTPDVVGQIVTLNKNVVAIKEVSEDVGVTTNLRLELNRIGKSSVSILLGSDSVYAPALLVGANGVISVTSNLIPQTLLNIFYAAQTGNWKEVQALHLNSYCINSGIFAMNNPVGIKAALAHVGLCESYVRPPLYAAQGEELQIIKQILLQLEKNKVTTLCR